MSDTEAIRKEYARLDERFRARQAIFEQTQRRHKIELEMVYGDLVNAGAEHDRFVKAHPEVLERD